MNKPEIRIYTSDTEYIDREMTDAEFAQYEKDQAEALAIKESKIAAEEAKTALLSKLGITADEAKLLLG